MVFDDLIVWATLPRERVRVTKRWINQLNNHTVDLWSLGVIIYELFVGTPPFYTNSIYTLIHLIVKDPVKFPDNMSPEFKSFLQGLLNKTPSERLSWPELMTHPFVRETD